MEESGLPRVLPAFTPRTITDAPTLEEALEDVRGRGWAVAWKELDEDLAAAAAAVRDHRGLVIAAVTISIPTSRCDPDRLEELGATVASAAAMLSAALGWQAPAPAPNRLAPPGMPG